MATFESIDTDLERLPDIDGIPTFRAPAGVPPRFVMFILAGLVRTYGGRIQAVDSAGQFVASAE